MQIHDRLDDREPEARARRRALTRRIDAVQAIEDALLVLLGDRRPGVADLDGAGAIGLALDDQAHTTAARRIAQRVGQQIAERALQQRLVGPHARHSRLQITHAPLQPHAALLGHVFEIAAQPLAGGRQLDPLALDRCARIVGPREEQHVLDQPRDALVLLHRRLQHRAVLAGTARPLQRDLRLAEQVVDRRAQVVCQIRRKLRQPLERALQPIEHAVEGEAGFDELLRHVVQPQALAERACADAAGRAAQAPRDDDDAPGDRHAEQRRGQRAEQHGDDQHLPAVRHHLARVRELEGQRHQQRPRRVRGELRRHRHAGQHHAKEPAVGRRPHAGQGAQPLLQRAHLLVRDAAGQRAGGERAGRQRGHRHLEAVGRGDHAALSIEHRDMQAAQLHLDAVDQRRRHALHIEARLGQVVAQEREVGEHHQLAAVAQLLRRQPQHQRIAAGHQQHRHQRDR